MRCRLGWVALVLLGLGAAGARGQGVAVQLPTYSFFSTRTTVVVPDRGSAYLGGVKRARSGMSRFGAPLLPFGNRSLGFSRSATGARVSVFVHDFEAMDEYLLSQPTAWKQKRGLEPLANRVPRQRPDAAAARPAGGPAKSVAQLRAERVGQQQASQRRAVDLYQRGRRAEAAGKANVARNYYQMAARRAGSELKAAIAARLDAITSSTATSTLARNDP